jgi:hypothetical protein
VKVRFLADADLNRAIVSGVLRREPSLDFLTAQTAGLRGMNDPQILALAAQQERVLVSHDVGTMPALFRAVRKAGKHCSGYSSFRRASISGQQLTNSCSSGWHRKHRSGKTGWCGCHCELYFVASTCPTHRTITWCTARYHPLRLGIQLFFTVTAPRSVVMVMTGPSPVFPLSVPPWPSVPV